jgi:hypothetical protein
MMAGVMNELGGREGGAMDMVWCTTGHDREGRQGGVVCFLHVI